MTNNNNVNNVSKCAYCGLFERTTDSIICSKCIEGLKNCGTDTNKYKVVDNVNKPEHYKCNGKETIDIIDDVVADKYSYYQGNIIKYITRWDKKHESRQKQLEDLLKANWYLQRLIINVNKDLK